jgi:hypothetical protein
MITTQPTLKNPSFHFGDFTMFDNDDEPISAYETWSRNDPAIQAQRARAEADTAAGDASRAAKRAEESAALSRKYPASDAFRQRSIDDRQDADNRARFAAKIEQDAKAAEAKIAPVKKPAAISTPSATSAMPVPIFNEAFRRRQAEVGSALNSGLCAVDVTAAETPKIDADAMWRRVHAANASLKRI